MKLLFSEYKSDYDHYIFPYAIWGFPEADETPAFFFDNGFLPSSRNLDRYYMCRHVRVKLKDFVPSSENRRILRKGENIAASQVERAAFEFNLSRREFCKQYADNRFGQEIMTLERLDGLFNSSVCTHVMIFTDQESQKEIGLVVLYLQAPAAGFYYYSFYDLNYLNRNLGMYMMTRCVLSLAEQGFEYIYLGSCYSRNALYKTQFAGFQFWNGFRWSENLEELKYLISRDSGAVDRHLLEDSEYQQLYYPHGIP
ncbi:MAG: hypothetical protein EHM72_16085 [Calditrichaeota bacterium]|nr:MAG: hypothetical protein EHM72_16085 [Calditrichota bacterium]